MKGILYGVGTGPGDPELLTLKALRIIKESDVIVIPSDNPADCAAYRTAEEAWPQIREKDLLCLSFPMTRNREEAPLPRKERGRSGRNPVGGETGRFSHHRRSGRLLDLRISSRDSAPGGDMMSA